MNSKTSFLSVLHSNIGSYPGMCHRNIDDCKYTDTCRDQACNNGDICDHMNMNICHSQGCNTGDTCGHTHIDICMDLACNKEDTCGCRYTSTCHNQDCSIGGIYEHTSICSCPNHNSMDYCIWSNCCIRIYFQIHLHK